MSKTPYFYVLQGRWTGFDRFFKIFITREGFAAAYVAGQVYDDASGRAQLILPARAAGPLMTIWVKRILKKRAEREELYETVQPGSTEFLAADPRNFLIDKGDVEHVLLKPKRSLWTAVNCGTVRFQLWSGKCLKFVLAGEQELTQVEQKLIAMLGQERVKNEASF